MILSILHLILSMHVNHIIIYYIQPPRPTPAEWDDLDVPQNERCGVRRMMRLSIVQLQHAVDDVLLCQHCISRNSIHPHDPKPRSC